MALQAKMIVKEEIKRNVPNLRSIYGFLHNFLSRYYVNILVIKVYDCCINECTSSSSEFFKAATQRL